MSNEQKRYPDQEKQAPQVAPEYPSQNRDKQTSGRNMNDDQRSAKSTDEFQRDQDAKEFKTNTADADRSNDRKNQQPDSNKWM